MMASDRVVSLKDMLELNASAFLGAATQLARMHEILSGWQASYDEPVAAGNAEILRGFVENFRDEAERIGARLAVMAASRLVDKLQAPTLTITVAQSVVALNDIESRFADFLTEIKLFTLSPQEAPFMEPAESLLDSQDFSVAYPSASFEVEEAAKCVALGRYTASVFHAMRMLEIGIRALSKRLSIPDPTKPSEKNWGKILVAVKDRIDHLWPSNTRLPKSEGAAFERLYAHLDAVRNPWRNATMHVETIYAPHEALHIIRCSAYFMKALAELTDESGSPPPTPPSAALVET